MKAPVFRYVRPGTLSELLELLATEGDDARLLAGGQSLVPLLNMRMARPSLLLDIGIIPEMSEIGVVDGFLQIGAGVTQRVAEQSPLVKENCPLLSAALPHIGHLQIRTLGTVGGSIAHADPAAELPAVVSTLGATCIAESVRGERSIPAEEFFLGAFTNALEQDEILRQVRFPVDNGARYGFEEMSTRAGDFAVAGVAGRVRQDGEDVEISDVSLYAFGTGSSPLRLEGAEQLIQGEKPTPALFAEAAREASDAVDNDFGDIHADGWYRAATVGELTRRVLESASR